MEIYNKILNYEMKLKRKGFIKPNIFSIFTYPDQKSCFQNCFVIAFTYKHRQYKYPYTYLDYGLYLNTNYECAGLWDSKREAKEFILKKFYN